MKKHWTRMLAAVCCLTMTMTGTAFAAGQNAAQDAVTLPQDVAEQGSDALKAAVTALMGAEAITGDRDGLFHAEDNLTRAQVCKILVSVINPEAKELTGTATVGVADSDFSDMRGYGWAEAYINYAANHEIAKGYTDGTFKPGSNVTVAELLTFAVRACGYTDSSLGGTWPNNYIAKANELKLLSEPAAVGAVTTGAKATKGQAAMVIYNAMDDIKAAQEAADKDTEDTPQGTNQDTVTEIPNFGTFSYANGAFDSTISEYNNRPLADDVKVYVYGLKKDYKQDMTFGAETNAYRETNADKYKSVKTPAFYQLTDGKITSIVVPSDVGFTGKIYCVITGTNSWVLNYSDEQVTGIKTLTAGREITWFAKKGLSGIPVKREFMQGEIYELTAKNGEITQIAKASEPEKIQGRFFKELPTASGEFSTVAEKADGMVRIGESWYPLRDNATVYVLEDGEYRTGRQSDIRKDGSVRLYDISDDDETSVDMVVVSK